ncbi:MAG TPA: hypothetical protein VJL59_25930 [Anaerolineales bacterium]|nr:hypothetical protein [Anaerolineales bacterium]
MKSTDKFLIGIVGGVILLIVVAFAVAFLRPKPTYLPDDTPEGVAHNYLFALQQKDYARAYGYLSPTISGYPKSAEVFADDVNDYSWYFGEASNTLQVESSSITGDRAVVLVRETVFYEGGLFNSSQYANTFEMTLRRDAKSGAWKIVESDSYWAWCWNNSDGCR